MSDIKRESDQNFAAFEKELSKLTAPRGKYFLMRGGKIINFYDTLQDAHSTGAAVYDNKMFSVVLLRGAKNTAKKKTAKKKAAKKETSKKKTAAMATLATATMPRREAIPGIAPDLPDISNWKRAAEALKIRPFYTGPNSRPFSCLKATQMGIFPPIKRGGVSFSSANDFLLAEQCRS
jgi:hypothetical protein